MSVAQALVETAVSCLALEPYVPPADTRISSIERRLDTLQELQEEDRLRCFLSFRFNEQDTAAAAQVERFLELQGADVVTGRSYEPRRVEDKVKSRLSQSLDFVVYLLTASGDSAWVRDEIAEARAVGIPVIPLVEQGMEFEAGLFGNIEHIPFGKGHVGDVWISLSEAIGFIRANKRHVRTRPIDRDVE